jgi:hypothetical protein
VFSKIIPWPHHEGGRGSRDSRRSVVDLVHPIIPPPTSSPDNAPREKKPIRRLNRAFLHFLRPPPSPRLRSEGDLAAGNAFSVDRENKRATGPGRNNITAPLRTITRGGGDRGGVGRERATWRLRTWLNQLIYLSLIFTSVFPIKFHISPASSPKQSLYVSL